jgi:hypothetical protein
MSALLVIWGVWLIFVGFNKYYKYLPISKWSFKRIYYMFAYCMWGLGFAAMGLGGFFPQIARTAQIFYGVSFMLMVFAPCGMKIFNTERVLKIIRTTLFLLLGILSIASA